MSRCFVRTLGLLLALIAVVPSASAEQQIPAPITDQPWREVVISVTDLDRAARFFVELGGYEQKWAGWLTPAEAAFWGLDSGAKAEALLLGPPADDYGLLRLVRFDGVGYKRPARPGARPWDTGCYFSIKMHVASIDPVYYDAIEMGWWTETPITETQLAGSSHRAVMFRGPDGMQVQAIELPESVPDGARLSAPFSVSQTVRDREAAYGFFARVLGFPTLRHDESATGNVAGLEMLGIPEIADADIAHGASELYSRSRESGRVEVVGIPGLGGHDHSARCKAPNLGILALRYPVKSTKDALYDIAWRGGRVELFASGVQIAPYGNVRLFNVKTPDGANVQFFEQLDAVDDAVEGGAGAHGF